MKRTAVFFAALAVAVTALCMTSCKKDGGTGEDSDKITYSDTTFDESLRDAILNWGGEEARDFTFTSYVTMIDNGNEEEAQGSAFTFSGRKKDGMYYGKYSGISSAFSFQIDYEYYFADGTVYQKYTDPDVEELNERSRYTYTEEQFLCDFDGLDVIIPDESLFDGAAAKLSSSGVTTVTLTVPADKIIDTIMPDLDDFALRNGVDADDIKFTDPVITYAIKDGVLTGSVVSLDATFDTDDGTRLYQIDREITINKVGAQVERITLPEDAELYTEVTFEE